MLETVEDPGPHRGQEALPDGADLVDLPARDYGPDDVDPEEQQHYPGETRDVARQDVAVDGTPDQPGSTSLSHRPQHDQREDEQEFAAVGTEFPEQPPGGRRPFLGAFLRGPGYGFDAPDLSPPSSGERASSSLRCGRWRTCRRAGPRAWRGSPSRRRTVRPRRCRGPRC